MAGTSPRRSSRARTTQPQSQNSSTTSSSSGRAERSTRTFTKTGSPQKSTGSGSLSSEPPEDSTPNTASTEDTLLRRRSMRGKEDDRDKQNKTEHLDMATHNEENEIQEEDEAVRCVCGYEEWPGPPQFDDDLKNYALRDAIDLGPIYSVVNIAPDNDLAGFFVQCDVCKVWEHGLCVGIVTEESAPDEYYCESCRKDLHKIFTARNGQKYSIYLPIHRPSRTTSRATSAVKDGTRSPRSGDRKSSRGSAAAQSAASKRRSTMNSRDAAYDEEEQFRRAIEASKEDVIVEQQEPTTRRPKRGRDDDAEHVENIKRQRTTSKSPSPLGDQVPMASREDSEDDSATRNGAPKKSYRNAVRSQRERVERDERREEQERKRTEAANKRKGRAERRRADESDPSEETPLAVRAAVNRTTESAQPPDPPVSSQPAPDTPSADKPPASSQKKKAISQHKRGKGRNQYTKDRDLQEKDDTPARSMSHDITRNVDENSTAHTKLSAHEGGSKLNSKARGGITAKLTMTDMKRRAHNILEFISRTQVELANEPMSGKNSPHHGPTNDGTVGNIPAIQVNDSSGSTEPSIVENGATATSKTPAVVSLTKFKDLNCVEMMDALTRDLVKWQQEFAP